MGFRRGKKASARVASSPGRPPQLLSVMESHKGSSSNNSRSSSSNNSSSNNNNNSSSNNNTQRMTTYEMEMPALRRLPALSSPLSSSTSPTERGGAPPGPVTSASTRAQPIPPLSDYTVASTPVPPPYPAEKPLRSPLRQQLATQSSTLPTTPSPTPLRSPLATAAAPARPPPPPALPPVHSTARVVRAVQQPPLSLLLCLQAAPPKVIFSTFQAECEEWGVQWSSSLAQRIAVYLFTRHPIAQRFPPRPATLRALLKQYITLIDQPAVTQVRRESGEDPSEDGPVHEELMEAYIQLSVSMDADERDMCYKSFYNTHADNQPACAAAATALLLRHFGESTVGDGSQRGSTSSAHHASSALAADPLAGSAGGPSSARQPIGTAASSAAGSPYMVPITTAGGGLSGGSDHYSNTTSSSSFVPPALGFASAFAESQAGQSALSRQVEEDSRAAAAVLESFCSLKVAAGQFTNVGLSLWPAAFVLVELLAQELSGASRLFCPRLFPGLPWPCRSPLAPKQRLRVLELGAGVGLTPCMLHSMKVYRDCVDRYITTDYQPVLLENIRENLRVNGLTEVDDFYAAERGLEGEKSRPFHLVAPMDWTQHRQNEASLVDWGSGLILAADCIYDVEVIPALVRTIRLALTAPSRDSIFEFTQAQRTHSIDASVRRRTAVVVQTHRQNSTMKRFFDLVAPFATVQSFRLVSARTPEEFLHAGERLSLTRDGTDGGVIPLGSWAEEDGGAAGADAASGMVGGHSFFALKPDVVLEDGSLRSLSLLAGQNGQQQPSTAVAPAGACDAAALERSLTPQPPASRSPDRRLSPLASAQSTHGRDVAGASPSGSHSGSANSSFAPSVGSSTARYEGLLKDQLIGPFYTSMAGLIGVHILHVKETGPVAPAFTAEKEESGVGAGDRKGHHRAHHSS